MLSNQTTITSVVLAIVAIVCSGELSSCQVSGQELRSGEQGSYFPPADSKGGWRKAVESPGVAASVGVDQKKLDDAFDVVQRSTKNGGLLVVRRGWLVYERYFGQGHQEATCNLASCGKSVTSVAIGMLLAERPDLFPDGLDQKVF